jgi:hypothetical protein
MTQAFAAQAIRKLDDRVIAAALDAAVEVNGD